MHCAGHAFDVLAPSEITLIHQGALRILSEMGMEIQNQNLLRICAGAGLPVDLLSQRVRFPSAQVEKFIAGVEKIDWQDPPRQVSASAGIYNGLYHDPETGKLIPWTEALLANYIALACSLPRIGSASLLGSRIPCAAPLEPLYERFYAWKYGAHEGGSIYLDQTCPYLLELYQTAAAHLAKPIEQVFDANVYLVPAMKLGVHEAYQVDYFHKQGLRVGIGDMLAMGANTPVTVVGGVTLNLAEQIALAMLNQALYGENTFHLHISLAPMDMRTMIYPFGRPESTIANIVTAQLARFYGVPFSGHAGLTSAKLPSAEAGAQKAFSAVATLLAGGNLWLDAGLLAIDEVYSPIQLVLDDEMLGALERLLHESPVTPEALGIETILSVGPGGGYLDRDHTVEFMRRELWQPSVWTRSMLGPWQEAGMPLDVDIARQKVMDAKKVSREPHITAEFEKDLLKVIDQARRDLD